MLGMVNLQTLALSIAVGTTAGDSSPITKKELEAVRHKCTAIAEQLIHMSTITESTPALQAQYGVA